MLNFGWYSTEDTKPVIRFGTQEDMSDAKEFTGNVEYYKNLLIGSRKYSIYSNQVTVSGLERNNTYYYQRYIDGKWEKSVKFVTRDPDNFNFIFVGDPQIGGSHGKPNFLDMSKELTNDEATRNDAFNWERTMNKAFELKSNNPPSLLLSAGDQADDEKLQDYLDETQFSALLQPAVLKGIPHAMTVGNHEQYNENFRHHFNTPNSFTEIERSDREVIPGFNYFFRFNNVLVVVLDTNEPSTYDYSHTMKNAVTKYPDTTWRIVMFHHDLFGIGRTHSQGTYIVNKLRPILNPLLAKYKVDLVINGHDHYYSTSHFVSFDGVNYDISEISENKTFNNPKGILYITANCATGSKLNPRNDAKVDYIYHSNQTYTATFGIIDFEKDIEKQVNRITINYYDVESLDVTDGSYIIEKDLDYVREEEPEPECWAEEFGYECCLFSSMVSYVDDKGRYWDFQNGNWCGVTNKPMIINKSKIPYKPNKCWSLERGIQCCPSSIKSTSYINDGVYGVVNENNGIGFRYCGIQLPVISDIEPNNNTPVSQESTCWANDYGYDCCGPEIVKGNYIDNDGIWYQNDSYWCGLVTYNKNDIEIVNDQCWPDNKFKCCSPGTKVEYTDEEALWGVENGNWCYITRFTSPPITTTPTTTKTTTTATTTTTTTTTKTPQPTVCAQRYGQCGGIGFNGPKCCEEGYRCIVRSDYYYQCDYN